MARPVDGSCRRSHSTMRAALSSPTPATDCPPARAHAVNAGDQVSKRCQTRLLEPAGDQRGEPGDRTVAGARLLRHQLLEPAERLELSLDEPCPPRGAATASSAVGIEIGLLLLGLRGVFQPRSSAKSARLGRRTVSSSSVASYGYQPC